MKKSILSICVLLLTLVTLAQPPQKMSYQTVIRNATDDLVSNATVGIQISVLQGSSSGTAVYVETHAPMTNANGLASLEIGTGTPVTGTMEAIDWGSGPYFLKSEVDIAGGTNYTLSLVSELLSVPYALHAGDDGDWTVTEEQLSTDKLVGIGISDPSAQLDVMRSDGIAIAGAADIGVYGSSTQASGRGVTGIATGSSGQGLRGEATGADGIGVYATANSASSVALDAYNSSATGESIGVSVKVDSPDGVGIFTEGGLTGVWGESLVDGGEGVYGRAHGLNSIGIRGVSLGASGVAVRGEATGQSGRAFYGFAPGSSRYAGYFDGRVHISGNTGIVTESPQARLHISEGNDTGLGASNGFLLLGETNSINISLDNNEIMAKNDGNPADLNLQIEGGNVLVGGEIQVNHVVSSGIAMRVNGDEALWYNGTYFSWGHDGQHNYFKNSVGIGDTTPDAELDVVGNIHYTGSISDVSDRRLKENLKAIEDPLKRLQAIQGYSYNMIDDSEKQREYGVMAQDLQKVFPEMVQIIDEENGYLGVSYAQLIPVLLEAIKEQQEMINELKEENSAQTEALKSNTDLMKELQSILDLQSKK